VLNQTESQDYARKTIQEMIRVTKGGGLVLVEFVNARRPFPKETIDIRLSFGQIEKIARECNCDIVSRSGVLVFSQSLLNRVPGVLIPVWGVVEQLAARVLWRWASRGYVLLQNR